MRAPVILWLVLAAGLSAQDRGTLPKDQAGDYPVHTTVGDLSLGAEYLMHSIPAHNQTFFAPEYLVVEVAVFPVRKQPLEIDNTTFGLRINGKKQLLYPEAGGFVAASVKYPDWEQRPVTEVQTGIGDANVTIGRPPVVGRFPGDHRPLDNRVPPAPRAPGPADRSGVEQEVVASVDEVIAQTALPEGAIAKPVSGFIYFHYKARPKSIKSVELVFESKEGSASMRLK